MSDLKSVVVSYQGGGYDGCVWEWNYAFLDKEGGFHSIFSSGVFGCRDEASLWGRLVDPKVERDVYQIPNDWGRLRERESGRGTLRAARFFVGNPDFDFGPTVRCSECDEECDPYGVVIEDGEFYCGGCRE